MADAKRYPTFSPDEMARRSAAVRSAMADAGIACLVLYGRGRDHDVQYLTNWPGTRESYVVFPTEGDPTLLVQLSNHLPNARRTATAEDVRWGGVDSAASVAGVLHERALDRGRVGLVGAVPWQHHARLAADLPSVELVDASRILRRIRLVKSAEELDTIYDDLFHGISQLPPILRTRRTAHAPVPDFTFRRDMVVVVQPNVVTEDVRMGMQVGETVRVTAGGIERLHAYPMRFVVCA